MPEIPSPPTMHRITVDVPGDKREQFHALWQQILNDEEAPLNQQVRTAQTDRTAMREAGVAALRRLLPVAQRDTGQSRIVARLLAGLYNGRRFPFDLTDLRSLDTALFEDAMALVRMDARLTEKEIHCYFESGGRIFEEMIDDWGFEEASRD
jgi:hypothetical protein